MSSLRLARDNIVRKYPETPMGIKGTTDINGEFSYTFNRPFRKEPVVVANVGNKDKIYNVSCSVSKVGFTISVRRAGETSGVPNDILNVNMVAVPNVPLNIIVTEEL